MQEDIKILSKTSNIKIQVSSNDNNNTVNLNKDLTKYYSALSKSWAVSSQLVNNEDYSAKYYAQNAKTSIENATADLKQELENSLLIAEQQVQLAKEQVSIIEQKGEEQVLSAETAANKAQSIADSLDGKYSDIDLSNISQKGLEVIRQSSRGLPIGMIYAHVCSASYVPEDSLPCDGNEYSQEQFPVFYSDWLVAGKLNTCTYAEYTQELNLYGKCGKFALDTENGKFRVPNIPDGTFIQQAQSDIELGKSYNAGLPNITGTTSTLTGQSSLGRSGAIYGQLNSNGVGGTYGGTNSSSSYFRDAIDASRSSSVYGRSSTVQPNSVALRYFVVITSDTINSVFVSVNGILNQLSETNTSPYIIKTYTNGFSWYRIWSDNWCEQGGFSSGGRVIYLKPFKDSNYTLVGGTIPGNISLSSYEHGNYGEQTPTSFTYTAYDDYQIKWCAFGYIA